MPIVTSVTPDSDAERAGVMTGMIVRTVGGRADGEYSRLQSGNEQARLHEDGEQDGEPESHECSPFCICSCRQVSANYNFTSLSLPKEVAVLSRSTVIVSYRSDYLHQPLDSIWQPPKFNFTA